MVSPPYYLLFCVLNALKITALGESLAGFVNFVLSQRGHFQLSTGDLRLGLTSQ